MSCVKRVGRLPGCADYTFDSYAGIIRVTYIKPQQRVESHVYPLVGYFSEVLHSSLDGE